MTQEWIEALADQIVEHCGKAPSNWYKPWEVAELIKAGPRPQDMVKFSEYIADHLNRALCKGYNMGMREAQNAPGERRPE